MRHTRNRQLKRFNKKHIIFCIGNLPIDFIREYAQEDMKLDPTFKWHRGGTYMSWVEFKPNPKETKLIPAK